eukprot:2081828-Prymnesium_polylepis.1
MHRPAASLTAGLMPSPTTSCALYSSSRPPSAYSDPYIRRRHCGSEPSPVISDVLKPARAASFAVMRLSSGEPDPKTTTGAGATSDDAAVATTRSIQRHGCRVSGGASRPTGKLKFIASGQRSACSLPFLRRCS